MFMTMNNWCEETKESGSLLKMHCMHFSANMPSYVFSLLFLKKKKNLLENPVINEQTKKEGKSIVVSILSKIVKILPLSTFSSQVLQLNYILQIIVTNINFLPRISIHYQKKRL